MGRRGDVAEWRDITGKCRSGKERMWGDEEQSIRPSIPRCLHHVTCTDVDSNDIRLVPLLLTRKTIMKITVTIYNDQGNRWMAQAASRNGAVETVYGSRSEVVRIASAMGARYSAQVEDPDKPIQTGSDAGKTEAQLAAEVFDPNVNDLEYFQSRKQFHDASRRLATKTREIT